MPNLTADARPKGAGTLERTRRTPRGRVADVRDKADVARLSPQEISGMTRQEMVQTIRAAQLPLVDRETAQRLMFCDRDTLERLVYLARRCCRNQGY